MARGADLATVLVLALAMVQEWSVAATGWGAVAATGLAAYYAVLGGKYGVGGSDPGGAGRGGIVVGLTSASQTARALPVETIHKTSNPPINIVVAFTFHCPPGTRDHDTGDNDPLLVPAE